MKLTQEQLEVMDKIANKELKFGCLYQTKVGDIHTIINERRKDAELLIFQYSDRYGEPKILGTIPTLGDCIDWIEENKGIIKYEYKSYDMYIDEILLELYKNKRENLFHEDNKEAFEFILKLIRE